MKTSDYISKEERKRMRDQRIMFQHIASIAVIAAVFIVVVVLGASIPGFYQWFDSINPIIQFVALVLPMAIFGIWRLIKML